MKIWTSNTGMPTFTAIRDRNLDRYELIKSVGRGQFSEVFKAYDKQTNEYVSIKHLRPLRKEKMLRYFICID